MTTGPLSGNPLAQRSRALRDASRSPIASAIAGLAAGALAWWIDGWWRDLIQGYARLDQVSVFTLMAIVGATIIAARSHRRRATAGADLVIAGLVAGTAGLAGITIVSRLAATSVNGFYLVRLLGWMLPCAMAVGALAGLVLRFGWRVTIHSMAIAALAGMIAGAIFSFPGPSELWQGLAFATAGAGLGLAIAASEVWSARATVERVLSRRDTPTLAGLREWVLQDGDEVTLGDARLACRHNQVVLLPATGGVSIDGQRVTAPRVLTGTTMVHAGRARYRIRCSAQSASMSTPV